MKKLLLIGSALTLISTSAMASQARLLALGMKETDNEGMYHVSDSRNIFLNPAYINIYNNYVQAEYGQNGQSARTSSSTDSYATLDNTTSPKAMGGFMKKSGDYVYGLYLGNESNTSSLLRIVGTSAIATFNGATGATGAGSNSKMLYTTDNQFDLFFGGDNGMKWAGNVLFATGKNDSRKAKDSAAAIRFGAIGSNWDAHINISAMSKAEATDTISAAGLGVAATSVTQEFKGKLGLHVGGSYILSGNNRVFGYVKHYGWEQKDSFNYTAGLSSLGGKTGTTKGDFTSYYLGWGSHNDVNTTDKVFYSVAAKKTDINAKFTNKGEIRHMVIPVTIAYEAVATEWLTLRGSVVQNIWGQKDNKNTASMNPVARTLITNIYGGNGKATVTNSTEVNAGASLTFGNLVMDGIVGVKATGSLNTDDLLTKAAVTYNF